NRNLEEAITAGTFRQDLFYRLNVVSLTIPPLRERREDVPLLATYFAVKYSGESKRRPVGISAGARSCMMNYDWPGNFRELENAIERAVVLTTGDVILPEDLPETVLEGIAIKEIRATQYHKKLAEFKKSIVLKAFEEASGNHNHAAELLGIAPGNLHRLIRNL